MTRRKGVFGRVVAGWRAMWRQCSKKPNNYFPGKGSGKSLSDKGKVENLGECGRKWGLAESINALEPEDFGGYVYLAVGRT